MAGKGNLTMEFDERLVKVCFVARESKKVRLNKAFYIPVPEGSVSDGQLTDPLKLAETLIPALAERGIKSRAVAFSLVTGKVATREVTLPPVNEKRIKSMIDTNASDYFPVDITKYHVSHSILVRPNKDDENPVYRIMAYAVPRALLDGYFRLAELMDMQLSQIDYFGNSIYNLLKPQEEGKSVAYINVDLFSVLTTVIKDDRLMFQRTLPNGADEMVQTYMSWYEGTGYVDALEKLSLASTWKEIESAYSDDIEDALSRVASSVARTVEYYNSSYWENSCERIVLTGPCAGFEGLRSRIERAVGLTTVCMRELPNTVLDKELTAATYSGFIGCAGSRLAPVDFIPDDMRKSGRRTSSSDSIRVGVVAVIGAAAIGGILTLSAWFDYAEVRDELAGMKKDIENLEYAEEVYLTYTDYLSAVGGMDEFQAMGVSQNENLLAFIEELEDNMPSDIRVLSAVCTEAGVSMNVTVSSKQAAATVIVELRKFETVSVVDVSSIDDTTDDTGIPQISFTVSCIYGTNPYFAPDTN